MLDWTQQAQKDKNAFLSCVFAFFFQLMPPSINHTLCSQQLLLQCIKEAGCTAHLGAHVQGGGQAN